MKCSCDHVYFSLMMRASRVSVITFIFICELTSTLSQPTPQTPLTEAAHKPEDVKCSQMELLCLSKDQLLYTDGKCYLPLERGPCQRGQIVVLDTETNAKGLRGRCEEQQCPSGLLPFLGRCQIKAKVRKSLCGRGNLYLDPTGNPRCGVFPGWGNLLRTYFRCSSRTRRQVQIPIDKFVPSKRVTWVQSFLCVQMKDGSCSKFVSGVQPKIILQPEK